MPSFKAFVSSVKNKTGLRGRVHPAYQKSFEELALYGPTTFEDAISICIEAVKRNNDPHSPELGSLVRLNATQKRHNRQIWVSRVPLPTTDPAEEIQSLIKEMENVFENIRRIQAELEKGL